jgi:hypothetical protein
MARLSALTLAAGLAMAAASLAHADGTVTGKWTYKVGATGTPCTLTFTTGSSETTGNIAADSACPTGLAAVGRWRRVGTHLQLMSPSGSLVAILHPDGDNYKGRQIGGGRSIALDR